jgi:hypothetical protein
VVLVGHDYTKQLSLLLLYMVLSRVGNILITNISTQIVSYGPVVIRWSITKDQTKIHLVLVQVAEIRSFKAVDLVV